MLKKKMLIDVVATASYLPEHSSALTLRYFWTYQITITNKSDEIVQLLNRYWRIVDLTGHIEEVRGPGVIGLQPIIKPDKQFSYQSFCQLATPQGSMEGHYEMQTLGEELSIVTIPKFELAAPQHLAVEFRERLH